MDWRIRLPGGLYRQAVDKAGGDAQLAQVVRLWLERYTSAEPIGAAGGAARAASLTPERRREIARQAVATRWAKAKAAHAEYRRDPLTTRRA